MVLRAGFKAAQLKDIEVYVMENDIGEVNNLADQYKNLLEDLTNELEQNYRALLKDSHIWQLQVN